MDFIEIVVVDTFWYERMLKQTRYLTSAVLCEEEMC